MISEHWLKHKVGARLQAAGLNFSRLAERLEITSATLASRLESPDRMRMGDVEELADELRVTVDWMRDMHVENALDGLDAFKEAAEAWGTEGGTDGDD